jgi:hypothetical protein
MGLLFISSQENKDIKWVVSVMFALQRGETINTNSTTTGATGEQELTYPSIVPWFTPGFRGVCVALSLVFCAVFCRSLSVLYVLFMPLYCLSLDLRLLNTCLVSLSKFFIFPNNIMFIYRNGMLYVEASWHSSYTRHSFTYRIKCGIYFFKHHKWIPFSHRVCVREGREAHCPIPIPWASVGIVMGKDWKSKLPTIETMWGPTKIGLFIVFQNAKKRWCKRINTSN